MRVTSAWQNCSLILLSLALLTFFFGCSRDNVEAALETDANGYICLECKEKFYTDRRVFPTKCPACKSVNVAQVVSFICDEDKEVNIGPRTLRSLPCPKCGKAATGLGIPREADLKAWGATHRSADEVN